MPRTLEGRTAMITGGGGGLGAETCRRFMEEGANVLPVDIRGDGVFIADAGTDEGNKSAIEEAVRRFGSLDILVLNAGVQYMAPLSEFPVDRWDQLNDVMVKGPFLAMKHAWAELTSRPGGRIIATASGSSFVAERYKSAYVSAKHGIMGLIKVAALEGVDQGLTANAVGPGWMNTAMVEEQLEDQMRLHGLTRDQVIEQALARMPSRRFVDTTEVASVIVFLASQESSGINGAFIPVDLGLLAS